MERERERESRMLVGLRLLGALNPPPNSEFGRMLLKVFLYIGGKRGKGLFQDSVNTCGFVREGSCALSNCVGLIEY